MTKQWKGQVCRRSSKHICKNKHAFSLSSLWAAELILLTASLVSWATSTLMETQSFNGPKIFSAVLRMEELKSPCEIIIIPIWSCVFWPFHDNVLINRKKINQAWCAYALCEPGKSIWKTLLRFLLQMLRILLPTTSASKGYRYSVTPFIFHLGYG